jgi:hypothetical protein
MYARYLVDETSDLGGQSYLRISRSNHAKLDHCFRVQLKIVHAMFGRRAETSC